jgi:hypothetical protein
MLTVRPVLRHFLLWMALAPIIVLEIRAFARLQDLIALYQHNGVRRTVAEVIEYREGSRITEIRYRFRLPGDPTEYTATDAIGRADLWTPISHEVVQALRSGHALQVAYLPHNPWVNMPDGRLGRIIEDNAAIWVIFVLFDGVWIWETFVIFRNFQRCITAAERRQPVAMRFWRARMI